LFVSKRIFILPQYRSLARRRIVYLQNRPEERKNGRQSTFLIYSVPS
jgi:hypothetical protein